MTHDHIQAEDQPQRSVGSTARVKQRTVKLYGLTVSSALTLLAGRQEEHPACKHRVMRCWCGYLSGARCRLFAYGPTDATASQNPIISCLI